MGFLETLFPYLGKPRLLGSNFIEQVVTETTVYYNNAWDLVGSNPAYYALLNRNNDHSAELQRECLVTADSTAQNIGVNMATNTTSVEDEWTLRLDNADTILSAVIPASTTGNFFDLVNTVAVTRGQVIDIKVTESNGSKSVGGYGIEFV